MAHQLRGYLLQQWRSSQDCNNLTLLRLHLGLRDDALHQVVGEGAAQFLKPPELHLAVCNYAAPGIKSSASFWGGSKWSVEVPIHKQASVIACNFAREIFAVSWEDATRTGDYYIVEVIEGHLDGCRVQIKDVIEPSAAFSHDGRLVAVVAMGSSNVYIMIYHVDGGLQLSDQVAFPCLLYSSTCAMNFSPYAQILAASNGEKIFLVDLDEGVIDTSTNWYPGYDMYRLAYSPCGAFLAACGCRLNDSLDGFIFIFNDDDYADIAIRVETDEEGVLACMNELVFSTMCAQVASFEKGGDQILLLDIDTQTYRILGFQGRIHALVFPASGDEMILAQANGVLLVSDMLGIVKLEVQPFGNAADVCAMSFETDSSALLAYAAAWNPEDERVREIENRILASAEQPAAMQGSEPNPEERAKKLADNLKRQRSSANSES